MTAQTILRFLDAYKELWIPIVLYVALNVSRRDWLVLNENPIIRGIASVLERVLVLEWNRWGGRFKLPGTIAPRVEGKNESETG